MKNFDVTRINIDNINIKVWAQQIREIKIREFQEVIDAKKFEFDTHIAKKLSSDIPITEAINMVTKSMRLGTDLIRMNLKLDILKKK